MVKSCLLFLFLGEGPGNLLELSDCETTELGDKDKRVTLYLSSRVMFDLISQTLDMSINRDEEVPIIIDLLFNAIMPIQPNARPLIQKYSNHNVFQTTFHLDPKLFFKDKCLEIKIHNFDSEDFKTFINYNASYISLNYNKTKSLDIAKMEPSCSETSATMFLQNDRNLTANFEARCNGSEDLRVSRISKRSVCFFGSKTTTKNFSFSSRTNANKLNTKTIQQIHKHESVSDLKIKDNFGIEKNVLRTKAKNLFNSSTSIKIYTNTKNQDLDKEKSFDHKFEEYKQCNTEPIALVDKHEKHNVESDKSNRWKIISVQNVPFSPISLKSLNNKSAKAISFAYQDHSARSNAFVDELTSCTYFSTQSLLNNSKSSTECALSKIANEECEGMIRKSFKKKFCKCFLFYSDSILNKKV